MAVTISRVDTPSEIDDLSTLRIIWGAENGRHADDEFAQRFAAWFERERQRRMFFVARENEEPLGMVNLVLFERMPSIGGASGGWGYLSNMFVVPEHRSAGVGAAMIATLLDAADSLDLERIVLNPTTRSVPFYERHGFRGDNQLMVRV